MPVMQKDTLTCGKGHFWSSALLKKKFPVHKYTFIFILLLMYLIVLSILRSTGLVLVREEQTRLSLHHWVLFFSFIPATWMAAATVQGFPLVWKEESWGTAARRQVSAAAVLTVTSCNSSWSSSATHKGKYSCCLVTANKQINKKKV